MTDHHHRVDGAAAQEDVLDTDTGPRAALRVEQVGNRVELAYELFGRAEVERDGRSAWTLIRILRGRDRTS